MLLASLASLLASSGSCCFVVVLKSEMAGVSCATQGYSGAGATDKFDAARAAFGAAGATAPFGSVGARAACHVFSIT